VPRPVKATGPVLATLVALTGWAAVAHNSGSGWVQALGCLLAGFAVVGLAGPGIATARLGVRVVANPPDATVGRPVGIEVTATAPGRVAGDGGEPTIVGVGITTVELVLPRRGAVVQVSLSISSAAPFGLLWWRRRVVVPLARPLWVAPLPGRPDPALRAATKPGQGLDAARPRDGWAGESRGVRPYAAGDARRLVHWPATAHHGALMVREVERPDPSVPHLTVALPDDGPAGDEAASRALGTVLELLARTSPILLTTLEPDGPRTGPVAGAADAGRRLARAVAPR